MTGADARILAGAVVTVTDVDRVAFFRDPFGHRWFLDQPSAASVTLWPNSMI